MRLSFDGYGCCDPKLGIGEINSDESKQLIGFIEKGSFEEPKASEILSRFFKENKEALWEDALKDHELI